MTFCIEQQLWHHGFIGENKASETQHVNMSFAPTKAPTVTDADARGPATVGRPGASTTIPAAAPAARGTACLGEASARRPFGLRRHAGILRVKSSWGCVCF